PSHVLEIYPCLCSGSPRGSNGRQPHRRLCNSPEIGLFAHIVRELALDPLGELAIAILRLTIGPWQDVGLKAHVWVAEPSGRERISVPAVELGEPGRERRRDLEEWTSRRILIRGLDIAVEH